MANTFKSIGKSVTNGTPLSTTAVAGGATQVITGLSVCNTYTTAITITVELMKAGSTSFKYAYQASVAIGDTLTVVSDGNRRILEATDLLKFTVNTSSGTADFIYDYLEIT